VQVRVTKEKGGTFRLVVRHSLRDGLARRREKGIRMDRVKEVCAEEALKFDRARGIGAPKDEEQPIQ